MLSRCLQFNLRPIAPQTILDHLGHVLSEEKIGSEPGALRLIARAARGSMRDALSLTDQAIAFGAGHLGEEDVRRMLGAVDRDHAVRIVQAVAARNGAALVHNVDALRGLGLSGSGTLDELCDLLQKMAVAQAVPDAQDVDEPGAADVRRLAELLPADETQLFYSIVLHGRADLAVAPDEYSGLVMVLLRMLAFTPSNGTTLKLAPQGESKPAAALPSAGAAREAALTAAGAASATLRVPARSPTPAVRAVDAPSSSPVALSESAAIAPAHGERWNALVRQMVDAGAVGALVRELAMQAQCVFVDEAARPALFRLRVERENLRAAAQVEKLQVALGECLNVEVHIDAQAGIAADSPARREQAERDRLQAQAEQLIHDDPVVRSLLNQYKGARIVPGSIKPH